MLRLRLSATSRQILLAREIHRMPQMGQEHREVLVWKTDHGKCVASYSLERPIDFLGHSHSWPARVMDAPVVKVVRRRLKL